jgi:hypothetical protein
MRSTAEVLDHHMKCFAGRDLDALLADYSADAMFFVVEGRVSGFRIDLLTFVLAQSVRQSWALLSDRP